MTTIAEAHAEPDFEVIGPYAPKRKVSISFPEKGRTKQSMAAECDINGIMAKYQKTGVVAHVAKHSGSYGFATSMDFSDAMNLVTHAQAMFNDLPSSLRNRFGGDPAAFLDFVQNPENEAEARELGLLPADPSSPVNGGEADPGAEGEGNQPPEGGKNEASEPADS